jgi:iron complex transport system ATP-binding protein
MVSIAIEALDVRLGDRLVLSGISAGFEAGTLIGVIGPNGAGKSTLARAILGLLAPADGRILIDGEPLAGLSRRALARRIAYLPQGQQLGWPLSVARLVALGRLPHLAPFSRLTETDRAAIDRAMLRTDVAALAARTATELSGGERARTLLARALAVEAPALIADEPLAALDPAHQLDVMALLAAEAGQGRLVVAILHDLTMAARFCQRLLLLSEGRLIADGPPETVLTAERLASAYGVRAWNGEAEGHRLVVPLERTS